MKINPTSQGFYLAGTAPPVLKVLDPPLVYYSDEIYSVCWFVVMKDTKGGGWKERGEGMGGLSSEVKKKKVRGGGGGGKNTMFADGG